MPCDPALFLLGARPACRHQDRHVPGARDHGRLAVTCRFATRRRCVTVLSERGGNKFGVTDCMRCERDLDHCHGTLVVHVDGGSDCTEPGCDDLDGVRHTLVVDCGSVLAHGCTCLVTVQLARAS